MTIFHSKDKIVTTPWQGLGAFVYTSKNLSIDILDHFVSIGGRWICPVIYNDDVVAQDNLNFLPSLKAMCSVRGIECWGWFNGAGGDPKQDAKNIVGIVTNLNLKGIILDLESKYQYPEGNADLMPQLLREIRYYLPVHHLGVSTNGMNSSMIYNGRILNPPQSFYDMGVRCLPQWYNSYYQRSGDTPQKQMAWLKNKSASDFNFKDPDAKKTSYRGLPLSYVHPTVEVTGDENSDMKTELLDLLQCYAYGLTPGFSIYTLENCLDSDLTLIGGQRGKLYF